MTPEAANIQVLLLAFIAGSLVGAAIYQTVKDLLK